MDTPCNVVEQHNAYTPLHVAQGMQITFCVISIIVVVYTVLRYFVTSIFEKVFKELLFILYFLIFVHSVIFMTFQISLVTARLTATDPCQAQISKVNIPICHYAKRLCLSLRMAAGIIIWTMPWIHISITIQRIVSTLTANEKMQVVARRIMIGLSIIYPSTIAFLAYRNESFEGRVPWCSGPSYSAAQVSLFNVFFLFALNITDLVLDIALLKYNQCQLKFDKSFRMLVTFRRRQIVYSIKEFLPSAIFHCACYIFQIFMVFYGRTVRGKLSEVEFNTLNAFTYVISFYCAFGPIILLILMRKGRLIRKENLKNVVVPMNDDAKSAHFSALQQQWKIAETRIIPSSPDIVQNDNKNGN